MSIRLYRSVLVVITCLLCSTGFAGEQPYRFGLGKADITGEAAEVGMMGYSSTDQKTGGIHTRQWSRAFIIEDAATGKRLVYVNTDLGMIFQAVQQSVLRKLEKKYPGVYNENNVMLAATHTHSGPGGFSHYTIYDLSVLGFQEKTFNVIVDGIVRSIDQAHQQMQPGRLFYAKGDLTNASKNRSLLSHQRNPDVAGYINGIDPEMTVLKFVDQQGEMAGIISWFPVHGTSMTNNNHLISSDNKGYASYHWEHDISKKPGFIAAFAQTNAGNLSPNLNLRPGSGPTENEFANTKEIGLRQFNKAYELATGPTEEVTGGLDNRFQFVDFHGLTVRPDYTDGTPKTLCIAALGSSLAAGSTEDGPGPLGISESNNPLLSFLGGLLTGVPSKELKKCQAEKQILADTGNKKPFPWTPNVLPIQMFRIGQLAVLGAPAEFTVMSGVRIRRAVQAIVTPMGINHVIFNGYANAYSSYVTTREEYSVQEYEGGSTIFGPWTQAAYQQLFTDMASAMRDHQPVASTAQPPDLSCCLLNFQTGVVTDAPYIGTSFGDVLQQPEKIYHRGQTVTVAFVTGHPKNNLHTEDTFLSVYYASADPARDKPAIRVATDNDWDTKYRWERVGISASKATISWDIPQDAKPGFYYISHGGDQKNVWGTISAFTGTTRKFEVVAD
ncbi:neutral/alkaline ceramidase [Pseudomonas piscis]|uniref:neutral/alkaline ceramidase n=1 Tax=Pseudomonas piscis TaxID=2614538 RepID=UPI0021D5E00A|nr:neutral/alkaline ceramidase [Pseudomonas piscis]MCU7646554.1 neutral/alkaline ceramidase [Pseudomonas piscis]